MLESRMFQGFSQPIKHGCFKTAKYSRKDKLFFAEHKATADLWFLLSSFITLPVSLKLKIGSHSKSVSVSKNPLKVNSIHIKRKGKIQHKNYGG